MGMACKGIDFLSKEYCRDPDLFPDDRNIRRDQQPPNHKHPRDLKWMQSSLELDDGLQRSTSENEVIDVHQDTQGPHALFRLIKDCIKQKDLLKGTRIHGDLCERGLLEKNVYLGNALISMYVKCGELAKAQKVLNELPTRDVVTWTALISGYAQYGFAAEALNCYGQMQDEGITPNPVTFICILKACGSIGAGKKGDEIHSTIGRQGLLEKDVVLATALVDMYAKCEMLAKAQEVFNELPIRDTVTWNALISGYTRHGLHDQALSCFNRMQDLGIVSNAVTFICALRACGRIGAAGKGEEIHAEVDRQGLLKGDIVLSTALIDMYAKCGALAKAQQVFNQIPTRNVVTWNALIGGYAQHGHGDEALFYFGKMQNEGLKPNTATFLSTLKACGSIGAVEKGEEIHEEVERQGLLARDPELGNTLVDMYCKCGALGKAQILFDKLPARNVVTWTSLVDGYAQHGLGQKALRCFRQMQEEGISPNMISLVCLLKACGSLGVAEMCEEAHLKVHRHGLSEDTMIGTALVDMYAKCGALTKAHEVFINISVPNVVAWTALIGGHAQMGEIGKVFKLISKMVGEGIEPNGVTLYVLLSGCSHVGLLEQGQFWFCTVSRVYGIIATSEHYRCMVDLLGRVGQFEKAMSVIETVPLSDQLLLWVVLMGACGKWVNVELGRCVFEHAMQLGQKFAATYICMSNIFTATGMPDEGDEPESGQWSTWDAMLLAVD